MPRRKTLLSPIDQWLQTARHVPRDIRTFERFAESNRRSAEQNPFGLRLPDALLREVWSEQQRDLLHVGADGTATMVGIIVRPHRLFGVGDVLRITTHNGMAQRYTVLGVSSKGVRMAQKYVKLYGSGVHNGVMRWQDVPNALIGYRWDDPAVCRFVEEIRADFISS